MTFSFSILSLSYINTPIQSNHTITKLTHIFSPKKKKMASNLAFSIAMAVVWLSSILVFTQAQFQFQVPKELAQSLVITLKPLH